MTDQGKFDTARNRLLDAQIGVIGSLLLDAEYCAGEVFARTGEEHYTSEYKTIYSATKQLYRDGKPIDPMTVRGIIGEDYTDLLLQIMEITPTAVNCSVYVDMLLEQAMLIKRYASEVFVQADKTGIEEDAVSVVIPGATLYLPLEDLVDFEKEKERLLKEQARLEKELARSKGMLSNEKFLSKAPEAKVQEEKEKLAGYEQMMAQVKERLSQMK